MPEDQAKLDIMKLDSDEKLLCVIRKHPFGILGLYLQVFIALFLILILEVTLLSSLFGEDLAAKIITITALVGSVLAGFFVILATYIYRQSKIILTDQSITQILQIGIFNRKVSQLSIANVEDVTASQKGILSNIFNYGTLLVETAGEQVNFEFRHAPRPNHYAKIILEARQQFVEEE